MTSALGSSTRTEPHEVFGLDFRSVLRAGDRICFGQACSEPVSLVKALLRQGAGLYETLGKLGLFVAGSYSGLIKPEHAAWFDFAGYAAFGHAASLARAGLLEIHPVAYSRLPSLLNDGLKVDVMLLQVSPPDADGRHSLGVANDYQVAVARRARVVVAEVNARTPFSPHALVPGDLRIHYKVEVDEPLVEVPLSPTDPVLERVAAQVAGLIEDGATIQMGVGGLMEAVCRSLGSHRQLGIHSGILIDGMADLMAAGVVTNARKGTHVGQSVAGSLFGSRRLFDFAHCNPDIFLAETELTHGASSLGRQRQLCAINSAIEVDLTGQVNAEVVKGRYVGAVGGQPDFSRAASQSEGGMSIIALPSTAGVGNTSRIVSRLQGPVTTARSDVDAVVTEWGVAVLRGRSLSQRARAMAEVAHPEHREALRADARKGGCTT